MTLDRSCADPTRLRRGSQAPRYPVGMLFREREPVEVAGLRASLREAAAWCERALSAGPGLRAIDLMPRGEVPFVEVPGPRGATRPWRPSTIGERLSQWPESTVRGVLTSRRAEMARIGVSASEVADTLGTSGRILCCGVNASLFDIVCQQESSGFLDEDDIPPCDTWVGLVPLGIQYLLAWVPGRHVQDVSAAMPCCPTEAYVWLETIDPRLERSILRGG